MKPLLAIVFATLYGLFMRILFGLMAGFVEIMGIAFLALLPMGIGFLTVMMIPKDKVTTNSSAFGWPWLTSLLLLVITILTNVEGAICWVMIFPFFGLFAGLGGVLVHYLRTKEGQSRSAGDEDGPLDDDWGRPGSLKMSVLLLLPALFGLIEGDRSLNYREVTLTRSIELDAPPAQVWSALGSAEAPLPDPDRFSPVAGLGMPRHLRTELDTMAVGGRRTAWYEKGLVFEERVARLEPERLLVLAIDIDPSRIPPDVMDEHIVIGGKYFDIEEDTYRLEPLAGNRCRVQLSSRYVVHTPFNWYAGWWAHILMADVLDGELAAVRARVAPEMRH